MSTSVNVVPKSHRVLAAAFKNVVSRFNVGVTAALKVSPATKQSSGATSSSTWNSETSCVNEFRHAIDEVPVIGAGGHAAPPPEPPPPALPPVPAVPPVPSSLLQPIKAAIEIAIRVIRIR
jgi:hypothetical protein